MSPEGCAGAATSAFLPDISLHWLAAVWNGRGCSVRWRVADKRVLLEPMCGNWAEWHTWGEFQSAFTIACKGPNTYLWFIFNSFSLPGVEPDKCCYSSEKKNRSILVFKSVSSLEKKASLLLRWQISASHYIKNKILSEGCFVFRIIISEMGFFFWLFHKSRDEANGTRRLTLI